MEALDPETVVAAAEILAMDDLSNADVESRVRALVSDDLTARRLLDIIPEAFALVLVSHTVSG